MKYIVKRLTEIIYEVELASDWSLVTGTQDVALESEGSAKRARIDYDAQWKVFEDANSAALDSFASIKDRMETVDKAREEVIKQTRDVQKLSKQSIFSLHRGNVKDAASKLSKAWSIAIQIREGFLVEVLYPPLSRPHPCDSWMQNPGLRSGSFSFALEEFLEGLMLYHWCVDKTLVTTPSKAEVDAWVVALCGSDTALHTQLLSTVKEDNDNLVLVKDMEYYGALSDFTGELGRVAVVSATNRDMDTVERIHTLCSAIQTDFLLANVTGQYSKKLEAIDGNVKKLDEILYNMTLLRRSGRMAMPSLSDGDDSEKMTTEEQ